MNSRVRKAMPYIIPALLCLAMAIYIGVTDAW